MTANEFTHWATEVLELLDNAKTSQRESRALEREVKYLKNYLNEVEDDLDAEKAKVIGLEVDFNQHEWLKDEYKIMTAKSRAVLERQIGLRAIDRLTALTDDEREEIARMPYPKLHKLTKKIRATMKQFVKLNGARR